MNEQFRPHILIHHTRRTPQPILPVNYRFFLEIDLPPEITSLPLEQQIAMATAATARRRAYPFPGPFGPIVAFEFRSSPRLSVFLSPKGKRLENGGFTP